MSDRFFGLGAAAVAGMTMFDTGGRRSGRTSRMVATVKPGDFILVSDQRGAGHIRSLLRDAGKSGVEVITANPTPNGLYDARSRCKGGSLYPDHTWIFDFFMGQLKEGHVVLEQLCIAPPGPDPDRLSHVFRDGRVQWP